ncbi:MAG: hypothetical protein AB1634_15800 [Thermodesulfobacteriota bacterium]
MRPAALLVVLAALAWALPALAGGLDRPLVVDFGVEASGPEEVAAGKRVRKAVPELGIRWTQLVNLDWERFEPVPTQGDPSRYQWKTLDDHVRGLQELGLDAVFLLAPTAQLTAEPSGLASAGGGLPAAQSLPAWERFLAAAFDRYNHDGAGDMPGLTRPFATWQVGRPPAAPQLALLQAAQRAKARVGPGITIVLAAARDEGLREVLRHPELFDAVDLGPGDGRGFDPGVLAGSVAWLRQEMAKNGYAKPIWCLDWTTALPDPALAGETGQAEEVVRLVTTMVATGVSRSLYGQLLDPPDLAGGPQGTGLLRPASGAATLPTPKPAFQVLTHLEELLAGEIKWVDDLSPGPGVHAWRFVKAREDIIVLWADEPLTPEDRQAIAGRLPRKARFRVFDPLSGSTGNALNALPSEIGRQPVILVTGA